MIKNERQYRITKAQAERFSNALLKFDSETFEKTGGHPLLIKAKEDALRSQLSDLEEDLREYEALRAGDFDFGQLNSIAQLPRLLIKARIARGLSQRDLAERLRMKEQQVQRYEASEYTSASLARIMDVAAALGIKVDDFLLSEGEGISLQSLVDRLSQTGLDPAFILKRLIPRRAMPLGPPIGKQPEGGTLLHAAAETVGRIFDWSTRQVLRGEGLRIEPALALGGVRFKVTTGAHPQRVSAYTVYAHYLSLLASQACSNVPITPIPTDPHELRAIVEARYGSLSLAAIVNYIWDLGVPVLALDDPGAFHGACFREDGRNVIVLKQMTSSESRWAFDLLHETWHAGQEPESPERTVLEADEMSSERSKSNEEVTASRYAGAVLLNGRGQELAERCLASASYDLRRLKAAVQQVAAEESAPVDSLANYVAFRLAVEQGENWWGTAMNLQSPGNPWAVVRNAFFERADFTKLAEPDRELLAQALTPWEEVTHA